MFEVRAEVGRDLMKIRERERMLSPVNLRRENVEVVIENEMRRAKVVSRLLANVSRKNVLDIGCGLGSCMRLLRNRGAKTVGLDINIRGKKLFGLDIRKFDLNFGPLPFRNKTFDIIICTEVLEHVFYPHFILQEIKRMLKDKGTAIISFPNAYHIKNRIMFLFGKKLDDHGIDTYGHHFLANIVMIRDFIESEFIIKKYDFQWLEGPRWNLFWRVFPWLKGNFPYFFARNTIMKCVKRC